MITIIGVGALGSHVALFLRNVAPLKLVDFDKVENKNTMSQFHSKMTVGKNKAKSLQQSFQGLFGLKVKAAPHKLTADNWSQMVYPDEPVLVIDCTDNIAARKLIKEYYDEHNIPCLHGSLAADGTFGQVLWSEVFAPDEESGDGATCEDGEHLPFFATVASHIALEAQQFLKTGKKRSFQVSLGGITRVA